MRKIYSLLLYIFIPIALIHLLWRSIKTPSYRQRIQERFGIIPKLSCNKSIWIHAASVGEVQASIPLIEYFLHHHSQFITVVTTTTPTGSHRIQQLFNSRIYHCYIPYDIPLAIRSFIRSIKPQLAIFIETEVWPNILHECKHQHIHTVLANARLSKKSVHGYAKLGNFARDTFNNFTHIAAQTDADAERLLQLGVKSELITIIGNIKFDLQLTPKLYSQASMIKEMWGKKRPIWIAASTHEGEDELLLDAHKSVLTSIPNAILMLVPRHPERFNRVAQLIIQQGFNLIRRSEQRPCNVNTQVILGDSMGELTMLFATVDVAFIGGSLTPHGGHNVLEAAALKKPIIIGPYVMNFLAIANELLMIGAAKQINTVNELAEIVITWLSDKNLREDIGNRGYALIEKNRGAIDKLINVLSKFCNL
jgi:3-deoxy-D-manno-octulosonic-acid transferase